MILALEGGDPFPGSSEPWVSPGDISGCPADGADVDLDSVCAATTQILRLLSGRRYGVRRGTVRPVRVLRSGFPVGVGPSPGPAGWPADALGILGGFLNLDERGLFLDGPSTVISVKVDGAALSATPGVDWQLYDRRLLVRMGGLVWPFDQRLDLADSEAGTWSVTYESGEPVPPAAQLAAAQLGCQLAKSLSGAKDCALPPGWTSVSRQGLTITKGTINELLDKGRTGLQLVDLWLTAVNPNQLRRRARIAGPESYSEARPT